MLTPVSILMIVGKLLSLIDLTARYREENVVTDVPD